MFIVEPAAAAVVMTIGDGEVVLVVLVVGVGVVSVVLRSVSSKPMKDAVIANFQPAMLYVLV